MKNSTKATIATVGVLALGAVGNAALTPEDPANLPILEQIEYYEELYDQAEKNGEALTVLQQTISELKSQLK